MEVVWMPDTIQTFCALLDVPEIMRGSSVSSIWAKQLECPEAWMGMEFSPQSENRQYVSGSKCTVVRGIPQGALHRICKKMRRAAMSASSMDEAVKLHCCREALPPSSVNGCFRRQLLRALATAGSMPPRPWPSQIQVRRYRFPECRQAARMATLSEAEVKVPPDHQEKSSFWFLQYNTQDYGWLDSDCPAGCGASMGLKVWADTPLLCRWLVQHYRQGNLSSGVSQCLELGGGVGIVSCVLATLPGFIASGGQIIVTDIDETCLQVARINAALNGVDQSLLKAAQLPYGATAAEIFRKEHGKFQLIIGADIAYNLAYHKPIFDSVSELLEKGGYFILGFICRGGQDRQALLSAAAKANFVESGDVIKLMETTNRSTKFGNSHSQVEVFRFRQKTLSNSLDLSSMD